MKLSTNRALKAGIFIIVLTIVAVLFVSIRQSQRVRDTAELVSHTQEVLFHIQKLVLVGLDNQTDTRGYVLSADNKFLEPVARSKKDIYAELALLKKLIIDNPVQLSWIDSLKIYFDKRIDFSDQAIALRQGKGLESAIALMKTGTGKYYSDRIRTIGDEMQQEETGLLEKRKKSNEQTISQLSLLLYSMLAVAFLLGIYIINRVGSDITKQKQSEKDLEQKVLERTEEINRSEKKYRYLFQNNPIPMWVIDLETFKFLDVNEMAILQYGYNREEFLSMSAVDIRPDVEKKHFIRSDHSVGTNEKNYNKGVWNHRKKNGTIIQVDIIAHEIIFEGKNARIILANDITERKLAEEKIKKINTELEERVVSRTKELRKSNEELEAFSYSVSHDLRAPLRGIIGFSAILEEEYGNKLDDEARRVINVIKKNTAKMGQLIDDLLGFSRMGRHNMLKTNVNTDAMVNEIVQELNGTDSRRPIEWVLHPMPGAWGDANSIRQVWINLISNAIKYSQYTKQPRIEIGSYQKDGDDCYYVKDNGVGFDEQYSNKLFKVFQRLHSTEAFEGTGVGLAIVEKIISKHGGKVWAEAAVDKGAGFYFCLPAELK